MKAINIFLLFTLLLISNSIFCFWENADSLSITNDNLWKKTSSNAVVTDIYGNIHSTWEFSTTINDHKIKYAKIIPGENIPIISTISSPDEYSVHSTIAISPETNQPAIAYVANDEIIVSMFDGSNWSNYQVTNNDVLDQKPMICFDRRGLLHLTWILSCVSI